MVRYNEMNSSIHDIMATIFRNADNPLDVGSVLAQNNDIKIHKTKIHPLLVRENGTALVTFEYKGDIYRTTLRGRHQAFNAAYCVEVARRLNIDGKHVDSALTNIPLNGRFEKLCNYPAVIFDMVESREDAKNFINCVDDYFGRAVQVGLAGPNNLHPVPFRRLIISSVFFPELCKIKQNVTIIFTNPELREQYSSHSQSRVVKTYVMDIETAIKHAINKFPDHKICIIGNRELYEKCVSLLT